MSPSTVRPRPWSSQGHMPIPSKGLSIRTNRKAICLIFTERSKASCAAVGSTQWSKTNLDYEPYVLIKAGDILFVGGTKKVVAYDCSDNGNEVWSKIVTGRVRGLAAANGHLFASTDTGHMYAFGSPRSDLKGDGKIDAD